MIDRLRACMDEGYNSEADSIFLLLHQIKNLFIMLWSILFPLLQFFTVPISLDFIRDDDDDNNSDDPQCERDSLGPTSTELMNNLINAWRREEWKAEHWSHPFCKRDKDERRWAYGPWESERNRRILFHLLWSQTGTLRQAIDTACSSTSTCMPIFATCADFFCTSNLYL